MSSILNDWAHRLERIMTESGGLVRGLQEFIDEAGGHEQTVQLLQEVILEPDLIEQIARRSYGHPNGYDKIIFVSRDSMELPYELRMHVWWAAQPRRSTDIHNHDWEFSSRVLCGRLECREYKLDEGGDLMPKYTYVRSEKGQFSLELQGSDRIKPSHFYSVLPRQSYSMQRTTLHRAAGAEGCTTATLVLQGRTHHLSSTIYRDAISNQGSGHSPLQSLLPEALRLKLQTLAAILAQDVDL